MKNIYKIFITIVLLFSFSFVFANEKERNENNNYGINKRIAITEDRLNRILNTKYVDSNEKIYDYSNILTEDERIEIKKYIDAFIEKTNMDLVILTDNLPYSNDSENADYAVDFYDYNDFGLNSKTYDGVILFRNTYEQDPYYAIYTTGNAQLYFSNERVENTLDNIYNYFVSRNYKEGIKIFIDEFIEYYNAGLEDSYKDAYLDDNGNVVVPKVYKPPFLIAIIIALITSGITISIMISKNKMVYKAKEANNYLNKETVKYNKNDSKLVSSNTVSHYNPPSNSGGSSGGGHSFSGSSGIGHGGGGRHG